MFFYIRDRCFTEVKRLAHNELSLFRWINCVTLLIVINETAICHLRHKWPLFGIDIRFSPQHCLKVKPVKSGLGILRAELFHGIN
jgi:hypothetical protein